MIQDIVDVYPVTLSVEEGDSGRILIKGPFGHCEQATSNGRLYRRKIMESNFLKLTESMGKRRLFGELDHPADGKTSLKRVSHIVTELSISEDGEVVGALEPLPTPMGNILKALAKAGCELGVSSRGRGSIVNRNGVDEVQDDFVLKTYDVVDNPASKNAFPTISESSEVDTFLEGVSEEHRDDVRAAFTEAAAKIDTFTLEDIKDEALRARVSDALGLNESDDSSIDEAEMTPARKAEQLKMAMSFFPHFTKSQQKKMYASIKAMDAADNTAKLDLLKQMKALMGSDAEESVLDESELEEMNAVDQKKIDFALKMVSTLDDATKRKYLKSAIADSKTDKSPLLTGLIKQMKADMKVGDDEEIPESAESMELTMLRECKCEVLKLLKLPDDALPAKVLESVTELSAERNRLHESLTEKLIDIRTELREDVTFKVREELMADPQVAGAKLVLENIASLIMPFAALGGGNEADRLRRDNQALADALKSKDFDLATTRLEAELAVKSADAKLMEARLSELLVGHPKASGIRKMIGPLNRLEGMTELESRVEAAFETVGRPESDSNEKRAVAESYIKARDEKIALLEAALEAQRDRVAEVVALGEQLNDEADAAKIAAAAAEDRANLAEVAAYAARKVIGRRDADRILSLCESAKDNSAVDRIIAKTKDAPVDEEVDPARVRRRATQSEDENNAPSGRAAPDRGMVINSKLAIDLDEAVALSGMTR